MEHNLAIKSNETLIQATMWMKLENITVNEITQTHKKYCILPLILNVQSRLINRNRKWISDRQRLGRRNRE